MRTQMNMKKVTAIECNSCRLRSYKDALKQKKKQHENSIKRYENEFLIIFVRNSKLWLVNYITHYRIGRMCFWKLQAVRRTKTKITSFPRKQVRQVRHTFCGQGDVLGFSGFCHGHTLHHSDICIDLKADNVLLVRENDRWLVHLADFGRSKVVASGGSFLHALTLRPLPICVPPVVAILPAYAPRCVLHAFIYHRND